MNFVVLSSSRGTTFQAVLDRIADGSLTARCLGLITDREDRGCVGKARAAGIPVKVIEKKESESREDYDRRVHDTIMDLSESEIRNPKSVIAALGWMFIFSPWFIAQWKDRIINVHPALLPKYGGAGMYGDRVHEAVLDWARKDASQAQHDSGITIHLMDDGVDTGQILLQKTCPVLPDDTVASLKARVQGLEKEWYPKVLQMIERGEMELP